MERLLRPVMKINTSIPASIASSAAYCTSGLSTIGSISLGFALVAGKNRVPSPATGKTAFLTLFRIDPSVTEMTHQVAVTICGGSWRISSRKRCERSGTPMRTRPTSGLLYDDAIEIGLKRGAPDALHLQKILCTAEGSVRLAVRDDSACFFRPHPFKHAGQGIGIGGVYIDLFRAGHQRKDQAKKQQCSTKN